MSTIGLPTEAGSGRNVTLRGTIERGAGAGERITADVRSAASFLSCRIVAESFAPGA